MSRLTRDDVLRFAYGEADELEEVVLADDEYVGWLEEIWGNELPRDLRPGVMRALEIEAAVVEGISALVDLGGAFVSAAVRYLTASLDESDHEQSES